MPRIYTSRSPEDRFWEKVIKQPSGCWEWQAGISDTGYGIFNKGNNVLVSAHRWSFERANGYMPADGVVMHTCDNRKCVNPEHLRHGSYADNNEDMTQKGRARRLGCGSKEKHPRAKLTMANVLEARGLWTNRGKPGRSAKGWTLARLALRYGVSTATLFSAIKKETWK